MQSTLCFLSNSAIFGLRVRAKITSQNWRSDLVQIWLIRKSKTTGIASYFEDFASEVSAKDGLKLRCKNVKLFLREPLDLRLSNISLGIPAQMRVIFDDCIFRPRFILSDLLVNFFTVHRIIAYGGPQLLLG